MATATINVPDKITMVSPASVRSTRPVGDVEVRWRADGPVTSFQVKVQEHLGGATYEREIIDQAGIVGDHFLVPGSTFEAGKIYIFKVIGQDRNIGTLRGTYSPQSFINIGTGVQFWMDFR